MPSLVSMIWTARTNLGVPRSLIWNSRARWYFNWLSTATVFALITRSCSRFTRLYEETTSSSRFVVKTFRLFHVNFFIQNATPRRRINVSLSQDHVVFKRPRVEDSCFELQQTFHRNRGLQPTYNLCRQVCFWIYRFPQNHLCWYFEPICLE